MAARGRPSKFTPEMCDTVIRLMSEGASKNEVSAELGINVDTLAEWQKPESDQYHADFSEAIKRGEQLSLSWWEKQGRLNLKDKEFSPVLWYMNMKNRHGWRDKQDITSNGETISVTINNA